MNRINRAKIYALYVSLGSVFMMFSALLSAYVVRQAAGNWLEFQLPLQFYWSTGVILLSSVILHFSKQNYLDGKFTLYKVLLAFTLILGVVFVILQYQGWLELTALGVRLDGNPSGSFVYVISGLHAAHVLGGIAALVLALLQAFIFGEEKSEKRLMRLNLTSRYWHFVDILWLYLFLFLLLTR